MQGNSSIICSLSEMYGRILCSADNCPMEQRLNRGEIVSDIVPFFMSVLVFLLLLLLQLLLPFQC